MNHFQLNTCTLQRNNTNELAEILYWLAKLKKSSMELLFQSIRPKIKNKINQQEDKHRTKISKLLYEFPYQPDIVISDTQCLINPHIVAYQELKTDIIYFANKYPSPLPEPIFNSILLLIYQKIKQDEIKEIKLARQKKHSSFHQKRKQQMQSINRLIYSFGQIEFLNYAFLPFCYQMKFNETIDNGLAIMYHIRNTIIALLNKIEFNYKKYPKYVWRIDAINSNEILFSLYLLATPDINLNAFVTMFESKFKTYKQKNRKNSHIGYSFIM